MRKIKINGREIEADDNTIKWLVFDSHSPLIENVEAQTAPVETQKKYCVVCHKEITEVGRWKFCSKECYEKHYEGKPFLTLRQTTSTTHKKKVCRVCGKKLRGRNRALCKSKECYREAHKKWTADWKQRQQASESKSEEPKIDPAKVKRVCKVCGGKLPKGKLALCSDKCKKAKNNQYAKEWYARKTGKKPQQTPETTQKTVDLGVEGEGKGQKKAQETSPEDQYKEARRRFILETTDKLCRYSGYTYNKAHAIATLQWEAIQMKRESLTPELRLLQSLARGETGVITGIHLQAIDPERTFGEFATWVGLHEAEIKDKLGITGHFIISNGYIRYQKN